MRGKQHDRIKTAGRIVLCLVLALGLFGPAGARAQSDEAPVRVGYYENEVFQEGAEEGAVKTGYAYEYYRKLSEYTGWKYEYVYGGYGELYQMLLDGDIDLLAGLAFREERTALLSYPDAIMGSEAYYLVKQDSQRDITADPATLRGKVIGVLDSAMVGVLETWLDDHRIDATVVAYPDHPQLFGAFDSGELDVFVAEGVGSHVRPHAEVMYAFGSSDYYLCVNIRRPDLLDELNAAQIMLAAEEPNYLNSLSAKYYSLSVTARAFSSAEREWMDTHDALHVGYLENYLPYSDTDADGQVTGIVKDLVPEILSTLGISDISVTWAGYRSYDDMVADMASGEIDVAFPVGGGLYYSEENGIYQSNPVVSASTEIVFRGTYSEDTPAHFAVNENNRMQYYYVRTYFPDAEITLYPSIDECLAAVLDGKAGCTTLNGLRANDMLKNRRYKALSLHQSGRNDDRCFGVEIGNEGLLKLLNRGVNVIGSDYAQNLSYRYTGGLYSYSIVDVLRDHMAAVGSVILAVAALVIFLLTRDIRRTRKEAREKEAARLELEKKNRELAESQEALSDALAAAEAASRAKTVFLNNMSHDIRTPMNAVVGFTALASAHIDDRELVQDYLGKISVSSQHLLSLINDVLDMSRIESGNVTIEASDVHLPEVIRDLKTIVQSGVTDKHLDLTVDTRGVIHEDIVADRLRLNQILLNILSNAIKFTPEGGSIRFAVTEKPSPDKDRAVFEFRISDTGIGMSEEFRKTIFDAFTRERNSTVSGIQGTGLGMAITKNIVDLMGGTISVSSEEGKGSEFTVELPFLLSDKSAASGPETETAVDFTGRRVLLAEDNEMNQMIATAILEDAGFAVEVARDGTEAVKMMAEAPAGTYDIVLMDVQMPRMDGYTAAGRIRAMDDPVKAGIPIVAVTANAFEEDRKNAQEAGMNAHLAKPYDIAEIMKTLARLLS